MSAFFTVTGDDVDRLLPERCVELFGDLLVADARKIKMPISNISLTDRINVPDGGIDASVQGELPDEGDLIRDPRSFYQIKAGRQFKPWRKYEIKEEFFGTKDIKKENLPSLVKYCFDNNGMYILVCMQTQLTLDQKIKAEKNIKDILAECQIRDPKVKVWGQNVILGCLKAYPSLSLSATGRDNKPFQSHKDWGKNEEMGKELVLGDRQEQFIEDIRKELCNDSRPIHVHVQGETGVGKTRLVFEATRESLWPLVIYCNSPREFLDSGLTTEIKRMQNPSVILVIDDCDLTSRLQIWDTLQNLDSGIKLVTIYNELEPPFKKTKLLQVKNLSDDKIKEIILQYYKDSMVADQLSKLCDGIPRVAHVIGWDLENNQDELLHGASMSAIFSRYIRYGDEPESEQVKQRERILLTISLFRRFGYRQHPKDEMNAVYRLVRKLDSKIEPADFSESIEKLENQKILQGKEILYITPKALHLWLWARWWKKYEEVISLEEVVSELPNSLKNSFFGMFEYAANSPVVTSLIRRLFDSPNILKTDEGPRLFYALSMADPYSAVDHLENTMEQWSLQDLQDFVIGQSDIIYGLERIVFEPDLFTRGGRILRRLAETENEVRSDNATDIFCRMFSLGTSYLSITKAPPSQRIQLLKETLCDQSEALRNLGLKACESALKVTNSRLLHDSGLRLDQKGWDPKTKEEQQEAYLQIIDLLYDKIKEFPANDQKRGAHIIINNSRWLSNGFPDTSDRILDKLSGLRDFIDDETILKGIISMAESGRDRLEPRVIARLKDLQDQITGHDYSSMMNRYVKMDIALDYNNQKMRDQKVRELARESLDQDKLRSQLDWLVTHEAKHGYWFGYELSSLDEHKTLLPVILEAQRKSGENGSGFFLGGYMLKIFQTDRNEWSSIMRRISDDKEMIRFFTELACRSGITDKTGMLLADLIEQNRLSINGLSSFIFRAAKGLSPAVVTRWIKLMLQHSEQKVIFNALGLFKSFFIRGQTKTLDEELTLQLLMHDTLFGGDYPAPLGTMADHDWTDIALELINQHPKRSLELCAKILENMGQQNAIVQTHSQAINVLDRIASEFPNETWDMITQYIDPSLDERGFAIVRWMRGGMTNTSPDFLSLVDYEKIFDWVDRDPQKRAWFLASHVPPYLKRENCIARELLRRYGDDQAVRQNLSSNFSSGFFSGSASEHYQTIKEKMLTYKGTEDDENVKRWIDFHVKILDRDIANEKMMEERMA